MKQVARVLGVAVLAAALLNASAGLCFCHRGQALPGSTEASGGCCHGPDTSGTTAMNAAPDCCHVESAEHQAMPTVAAQFAPPVARVAPVDAWSLAKPVAVITGVRPAASPPLLALRI